MSRHEFGVALAGLTDILARHLYANPDAFLRELVANAHDAIQRRGGDGVIDIEVRGDTVLIHDDGAGLSRAGIHELLSTIGRSGTAEARAALADRGRAEALVGRFGIGVLSAFRVARQIEIHTRAEGHEALRWTSEGDGYTLEPGDREAVGTTARLWLLPEHRRYLKPARLTRVVQTWADFLDLPIRVQGEQVNARVPPWEAGGDPEAWWASRMAPLTAEEVFVVDTEVAGARVQGVLGFPLQRAAGGAVDLYIARMLVSRGEPEALPAWARMCVGAVRCDALTPTAGRDAVVRDEALDLLRAALGGAVRDHLRALAERAPERLARIARAHTGAILSLLGAHSSEILWAALAPHLPLPTDRGPRTLDTLPSPVLYRDGPLPTGLGAANPIVDARDPVVRRFIERVAPERRRVDASALLAELDAAPWSGLAEPPPRVGRFLPAERPALLLTPDAWRARESVRARALPGAMQAATAAWRVEEHPALVLNASHPLVQALAGRSDPRARATLSVLREAHEADPAALAAALLTLLEGSP